MDEAVPGEEGATGWEGVAAPQLSTYDAMRAVLQRAYERADAIASNDRDDDLAAELGDDFAAHVKALGQIKHAARGIALTLAAYKATVTSQDIRYHKAELPGGFAARDFDTKVTIPFLIDHQLPRNVETHWLSQTFSFAGPYLPGTVLNTAPKGAGPLMVQVVNLIQESNDPAFAEAAAAGLFLELIKIRNAGQVVLTRPKALSISATSHLVRAFITSKFRSGAPRLPQVAIYAIYQCLVDSVARYEGATLEPLARMKSADRKAGTVGDVVVLLEGQPIEAVEIKLGPITAAHVAEVIEKVRSKLVRRYYVLSDFGVETSSRIKIDQEIPEFLRRNGCEIIVSGVLESLQHYLRVVPDTTDFLAKFADMIESDEDLDYEHRVRWNECCREL